MPRPPKSFFGKENRNPMKQFFITFPKSGVVDRQSLLTAVSRFEPDYYLVVRETHADGSPHLHAIIRCKNKYSKSFILKHFKEIYPNDNKRIDVDGIRSISNAIAYLDKEDKTPLTSGPYKDSRNPQRNCNNKFMRELGYNSLSDLSDAVEEKSKQTEWIVKTCKNHLRDFMFMQSIRNPQQAVDIMFYYIEYEKQRMFEEIVDLKTSCFKISFSIDDITNLFKSLNLKLDYNTTGVLEMVITENP